MGGCDLLTQNLKHFQFLLILGFYPEHPTTVVVPGWGHGSSPAPGRLYPLRTQGDVALSPPNQRWGPIFRTRPASPCRVPLRAQCGRGCSEAESRGRTRRGDGEGDSWGWDHALPDGEVPHFGGTLGGGRGAAFAQVLQRPLQALALVGAWAAVLGALHVIPGDPRGHGDG